MTKPIDGFTRISVSQARDRGIIDAHLSRVGWAECDGCGKVIQRSGLGIGSHRRACHYRPPIEVLVWDLPCNCENSRCLADPNRNPYMDFPEHPDGCRNPGTVRCQFIGQICGDCAAFMPGQYLEHGPPAPASRVTSTTARAG